MPVGDREALESPDRPGPGQSRPDMRILGDIRLIIVTQEVMSERRPEHSQGDQPEGQANPPPARQVRGPHRHATAYSATWPGQFKAKHLTARKNSQGGQLAGRPLR